MEFIAVEYNPVISTLLDVVERVPECLFYIIIPETTIVDASDVPLFVSGYVIKSSCVSFTRAMITLWATAVSVGPAPTR